MATEPIHASYASGYPTVTQLSVFLQNRLGELLRLTRLFDDTEVHILALSVVNSFDCAIVRMIVDDPEKAHEVVTEAGFSVSLSEILVVVLPPGKRALLQTWAALLGAEVNVAYTYALLCNPGGQSALAVQAENLELATGTLKQKGLTVLDQSDLRSTR